MNIILFLVLGFSVFGVIFAWFLKVRFSGRNYTKPRFLVIIFINVLFGIFYLELMKNDCVLFFRCFPELFKGNLLVECVAIVSLFLHCCAIPTIWEPRRLFRIRRKNKPFRL